MISPVLDRIVPLKTLLRPEQETSQSNALFFNFGFIFLRNDNSNVLSIFFVNDTEAQKKKK